MTLTPDDCPAASGVPRAADATAWGDKKFQAVPGRVPPPGTYFLVIFQAITIGSRRFQVFSIEESETKTKDWIPVPSGDGGQGTARGLLVKPRNRLEPWNRVVFARFFRLRGWNLRVEPWNLGPMVRRKPAKRWALGLTDHLLFMVF